MDEPRMIPLADLWSERPLDEMRERARRFADDMERRRTVRQFADRPVPAEIVRDALRAAAAAPSGANLQPWRFVAVSDPAVKRRIREGAEAEEREFYGRRAPREWIDALAPFGTDENKPFLDIAPWLIAIFAQRYGRTEGGEKKKRYYATESVGIATGILIAALHRAGLVVLTHTPSPMGFLNEILGRPAEEHAFLLLVAGYPAPDATVPDIRRLPFDDVARFLEANASPGRNHP